MAAPVLGNNSKTHVTAPFAKYLTINETSLLDHKMHVHNLNQCEKPKRALHQPAI